MDPPHTPLTARLALWQSLSASYLPPETIDYSEDEELTVSTPLENGPHKHTPSYIFPSRPLQVLHPFLHHLKPAPYR